MSISTSYSRNAVVLDTDAEAGTPVVLGGTIDISPRLQAEIDRTRTTGAIYPGHVAIRSIVPTIGMSSYHLQDWIDEIGLTGKSILSATNDGLELYLQKFGVTGPASGGVHRSLTVKQGILIGRQIRAAHQDDAILQCECLPIYDGTNSPIVVADNASLPTAPADNERFTIGGVTIGGVTIGQIQDITIDFGAQVMRRSGDGDVYDTFVELRGVEPVITIRTTDATLMKSGGVPLAGLAGSHANSIIYLRKRAQTGSHFVADGTAEHIKITAYGLVVVEDAGSQSGDESAVTTIRLACAYDGSNAPITFNTASAIT